MNNSGDIRSALSGTDALVAACVRCEIACARFFDESMRGNYQPAALKLVLHCGAMAGKMAQLLALRSKEAAHLCGCCSQLCCACAGACIQESAPVPTECLAECVDACRACNAHFRKMEDSLGALN